MPHELFLLAPCNQLQVQAAFEALQERLHAILPGKADIQHIGATAIPGCLTKGDLDLCIRVEQKNFPACDTALTKHFPRNTGSDKTDSFAAFHAENAGIQLVVSRSEYDTFTAFRDLLSANPTLLADYNALKQKYHGKPMDEYRKAKSDFIRTALSSV